MDEFDFHAALYRPGTLVDVGAHSGALTRRLAKLPGAHVLAFEPLPSAFARLTAALAGQGNVDLRQVALGATGGTITLEVPVVGGVAQEQWASVVKDYDAMRAADPRITDVQRFTVMRRRLDDFPTGMVTGIKVDAEGAEAEVLEGAADTLHRDRPVLSVEIEERHRPGSTRAVPAYLATLGYRGFYEFYGEWRAADGFDPATMQRGSVSPAAFDAVHPYVFTFYFVTNDRVADLSRLARLPAG